MDIHLSDGLAFNILTTVTVEAPIIFTTAYDEYAIEAFKVNSIDYLLKPIASQEVERALGKFRKLVRPDYYAQPVSTNPISSFDKYPGKILIPVNNRLIPIDVNEISYFYSTSGSTRAVLKDNMSFYYVKTLDAIHNLLDPFLFFRANKQFVISKKSVKDITIWFDNRLLVTLDTEVPERLYVSKNRAAQFKKWLTEV
jgi:DNA-binding LytR/AlgR family response regulator